MDEHSWYLERHNGDELTDTVRRTRFLTTVFGAALLVACSSGGGGPPPPPEGARIVVEPAVAAPGGTLTLRFPDPDLDVVRDRVIEYVLQLWDGDEWRFAFTLNAGSRRHPTLGRWTWPRDDQEELISFLLGPGGPGPSYAPLPALTQDGAYRVCFMIGTVEITDIRDIDPLDCGYFEVFAPGGNRYLVTGEQPPPPIPGEGDVIAVAPSTVAPGGELVLFFPEGPLIGSAFELERWNGDEWERLYWLFSDRAGREPENYGWVDWESGAPTEKLAVLCCDPAFGPDRVPVPPSAPEGHYRVCFAFSANPTDCSRLEVRTPFER